MSKEPDDAVTQEKYEKLKKAHAALEERHVRLAEKNKTLTLKLGEANLRLVRAKLPRVELVHREEPAAAGESKAKGKKAVRSEKPLGES